MEPIFWRISRIRSMPQKRDRSRMPVNLQMALVRSVEFVENIQPGIVARVVEENPADLSSPTARSSAD